MFIPLSVLAFTVVAHGLFVITPNDTLVMLGDSTQLNCTYNVSGFAAWYKGEQGPSQTAITLGNTIVGDDPQYEIIGDENNVEYNLRISNVDMDNEDNYECGDQVAVYVRAPAFLYVIVNEPQCSANPGYTVIEHEEVVFTCTMSKAIPPGELIWFMNSEVVSRETESLVHVWKHNFTREENGTVLDCNLQHHTLRSPLPSCEEEIIIDVQYLSEFNMIVSPNTTAIEGDDISIDCLALYGNPGPYNMTLTHDNKTVVDNNYGADIHHTITGVSRTQAGVYKCEAFTRFHDGSEERWVNEEEIVVLYSPDISAEEDEFEAPLGSFVELLCTANAFPTPTITWTDSDDDVIPGDEENRNVTTLIPDDTTVTSTLTVTVAAESYYGKYTCKAANAIPPSVQLDMTISEPGGSSAVGIAVTTTLVIVVVVAVIILAVYLYRKSEKKKSGTGNTYESSGGNDAVELNGDTEPDNRLEPEGLSNEHTVNQYTETAPSTTSSIAAPEAAYAVSVKQKRTSSKKSNNETGQNMTGDSNPDSAGLYAVSSKHNDSHDKKDTPKGELTYAELDLKNSGSKQQQTKPPEAEKTQYASIQIPKTELRTNEINVEV